MKRFLPFRLLLIFGAALLTYASSGQMISIVAEDFTSRLNIGDTIVTYLDTTTMEVDVGGDGMNNWDFSGLQADEMFVTESKTHSASPYSDIFPSAEYASNYSGIFAGVFSNTWVYNTVNNDEFISHGTATVANSAAGDVETLITFDPEWIQYKLPIEYGYSHTYSGTQTIKTTTNVPGFGEFVNTTVQQYSTRQSVDGYGVFTLPGGKKYEGLRVIEETTFEVNGIARTDRVIRIMAKTGETVHITPNNPADTTGVVGISEISWTSGDGTGELANRPEPPSDLNATAMTNKIDLTWTDNSDNETGFYIERSVNGGGFVRIDSTGANVTNYSDMDVAPGDVYVYRVFAYNNDGISTSTFVATASILVTVAGPGNLIVNISQNSIGISWVDNANNETGFYIERSGSGTKSAGEEFAVIDSVSANVTSYTDMNVEPGVDYSYRVRAYNETAKSDYSNTINAKIEITVNAPLSLAAIVNAGTIELTWTDGSDNEAGFYIERSDNDGSFTVIDSTTANSNTYSDANVIPGVQYKYRVNAYFDEIKSDYSNTAEARIIPTGFQIFSGDVGYVLKQNYPNPFSSNTTISFSIPEKETVILNVLSADGKIVRQLIDSDLQKGEYSVEFSGAELESGIYFYRLKTDDFVETKRMQVIQ